MDGASDLTAWDTHKWHLISWLNDIYVFMACCRLEEKNVQVCSLKFFSAVFMSLCN